LVEGEQIEALIGGPLGGLKIIEMEGVGPGPFAAMWLADMGATVIRINRPGQRYNQTRGDVLNRSRQSIAVDLKKPGSAEIVLRLIDQADALIEGFRPGVM
jgi:alpha-methylacyl-CoA racemase